MSEVVTGLLKLAGSVLRTSAAKKLQDGDLTDEKVRKTIIKQLDTIEFKLDGSNRKELCASESSLRQGIEHLIMSLDEAVESESSPASELQEYLDQPQDTFTTDAGATSNEAKPTRTSASYALSYAEAVQKLNVVSNKRLESAKKHLEETEKTARLAFHNAALSTEDRILASEIRITSAILKLLDDPELVVKDCFLYLKELHDMPAIKEIFSVENKLGTTSRLKSNFHKESRAKIVERVTIMNLIVAGFISKFTEQRMAVLDWPMIECGTRCVHPIHSGCYLTRLCLKLDVFPPWDIENNDLDDNEALFFTHVLKRRARNRVCYERNSLGSQIILDKTTGKLQPYCRTYSRREHKDHNPKRIIDVAVHEDGTAYVLWFDGTYDGNYMLSSYYADSFYNFPLNFFLFNVDTAIAVTKCKYILVCQRSLEQGEVFSISECDDFGELKHSFAFNKSLLNKTIYDLQFVSVSCDDEVIVATKTDNMYLKNSYVVPIFTEQGELQRTVKFRPIEQAECSWRITYNKVSKSFIVFGTGRVSDLFLQYFSDRTGELQRSYVLSNNNMPKEFNYRGVEPVCHPNGALAWVKSTIHYHKFDTRYLHDSDSD